MTREVVTFQIGHYSNYVGTHWWNIQDSSFVYEPTAARFPKELNHDVLFREGGNILGEVTYTPRLISVDLKGSLNTLKQEGVLYDVDGVEEDLHWTGDVTLHKVDSGQKNEFLTDLEEEHSKNVPSTSEKEKEMDENTEETDQAAASTEQQIFGPKFYDLDDNVTVWSDFLRLHLHPKSVAIVEQYRHGWEGEAFDVFGFGQEVYKQPDTKQQIEDRMHFFLEDCDSLQGIQLLVDTHDGFGGLASSLLQDLSDDYSSKSLLLFSLSPASFPSDSVYKECHRAVNSLLSYNEMISQSSMMVPLSLASTLWRATGPPRNFTHLNYKPELQYHSSAILGASIDTMTVPYRLETNATLMSHFTDGLTTAGRKILSLQTTVPVALRKEGYLVDYLQSLEDEPPWQPLTPHCSNNTTPTLQSVVVRGIPKTQLKRTVPVQSRNPLHHCSTTEDVMHLYLKDVFNTRLNTINSILQPVVTTAPYPHIFDSQVTVCGHIDDRISRIPKQGVTEVPMMTSLQSGPDIRNHLSSLLNVCSSFNITKFHRFQTSGLEEDEYKETLENVKSLMSDYGNSQDSDDSDSDEMVST